MAQAAKAALRSDTSSDVRSSVAIKGEADISRTTHFGSE
jgi:hypothetical protein